MELRGGEKCESGLAKSMSHAWLTHGYHDTHLEDVHECRWDLTSGVNECGGSRDISNRGGDDADSMERAQKNGDGKAETTTHLNLA